MSEINLVMHGDNGKSVVQELMQEIEKLRAENQQLRDDCTKISQNLVDVMRERDVLKGDA